MEAPQHITKKWQEFQKQKVTHLKIGTTRGQDNLVCLQVAPVNRQSNIHETLILQQLVENRQQVGLMIVPSETKPLGRHF